MVRLEIYRLAQYCFRDVLEQNYGAATADRLFAEAGHLAGTQFFRHMVPHCDNIGDFIKSLQTALLDNGIGILRLEEADYEQGRFTLSIAEDLDCSGLPELDEEICVYDEGFIAGLLKSFTGHNYRVKEVDCWCTGDRTCRFVAEIAKDGEA
jgi:predicted hydrocarbon binding protein